MSVCRGLLENIRLLLSSRDLSEVMCFFKLNQPTSMMWFVLQKIPHILPNIIVTWKQNHEYIGGGGPVHRNDNIIYAGTS